MGTVLVNVLVRATPYPALAFWPWPAGQTPWERDAGSSEQRALRLPWFHLHHVLRTEAGKLETGPADRPLPAESAMRAAPAPRPPPWAVGSTEPQVQGGAYNPQLIGPWT